MKEILVDTSLLIDFLQGITSQDTDNFLESNTVSISIITYFEACKFYFKTGRTKDWWITNQRLKAFKTWNLTHEICEEAVKLSVSTDMPAADAIIYATARSNGLKLATSHSLF